MPPTQHLPPRKLSFTEAAQFLTEKNIPFTCPSCNADESSILTEPDGQLATLYLMNPIILQVTPSIMVDRNRALISIVTECGNCGMLRHFAANPIFKWLDAQAGAVKS